MDSKAKSFLSTLEENKCRKTKAIQPKLAHFLYTRDNSMMGAKDGSTSSIYKPHDLGTQENSIE